jgi:1-acyl-sn-glycerol-3-phosphate acyltransferase
MVNTFELQPPGTIIPRLRFRPGVRYGKPLDFSRYYGLENDRMVQRAVTDEIMYALMDLADQEYVDVYAADAKAAAKTSAKANGSGHPHPHLHLPHQPKGPADRQRT